VELADLKELVCGELGARLERGIARPVALALSGGGDSLALLLTAKAWADGAGRRLVAFTVDHRLQAASAEWAAWCANRAKRLGIEHRTLVWEGAKPATGLPAAARTARHRLLAEAARRAEARVVLFGHTADDRLEAQAMRVAGVRIGSPGFWSPSPVWPEGREIFISRPLIGARRAEIRDWLAARGETWIEDPANIDPRHPRARARAAIAGGDGSDVPQAPPLAHAVMFGREGVIRLPLDMAHPLGEAIACVSGAERPPRRAAIDRLQARLRAGADAATLGGTRVAREGEWIRISRETGDRRGRACEPLALPVGETVVWDGRFEATAHAPGLILAPDGEFAGPSLRGDPRVTLLNLVPGRMSGACGVTDREALIELSRRMGVGTS
jgi:tRNA(Ile)-lysidine synthase